MARFFDDDALKELRKRDLEAELREMKRLDEERRLARIKYYEDEAKKKEELKKEIEEYDRKIARERPKRRSSSPKGLSLASNYKEEHDWLDFPVVSIEDDKTIKMEGRGRKTRRKRSSKRRSSKRRSNRRKY